MLCDLYRTARKRAAALFRESELGLCSVPGQGQSGAENHSALNRSLGKKWRRHDGPRGLPMIWAQARKMSNLDQIRKVVVCHPHYLLKAHRGVWLNHCVEP